MAALKAFEVLAVRLMATDLLSETQLHALTAADRPMRFDYTGSGYFLTVALPTWDGPPRTLSEPPVIGEAGDVRAGFVIFLSSEELTLECHTWGDVDVPIDFRDREVAVHVADRSFVDLRGRDLQASP